MLHNDIGNQAEQPVVCLTGAHNEGSNVAMMENVPNDRKRVGDGLFLASKR